MRRCPSCKSTGWPTMRSCQTHISLVRSSETHVSRLFTLIHNRILFFTGQLSTGDLQQAFQFRNMNLMANHQYPNPTFAPSSPPNLNLPLENQLTPQSPTYDPLSPPVSGSDTSGDNIYHSRNSSGTTSPASSRGNSLVHRTSVRYNPTPSPSSSSGRRRGRSIESEEDDPNNNMSMVQELAHTRKEATRKQRIEAEQRRRDELRDGYARLKDVLPVSNQKSSKVSLLERG